MSCLLKFPYSGAPAVPLSPLSTAHSSSSSAPRSLVHPQVGSSTLSSNVQVTCGGHLPSVRATSSSERFCCCPGSCCSVPRRVSCRRARVTRFYLAGPTTDSAVSWKGSHMFIWRGQQQTHLSQGKGHACSVGGANKFLLMGKLNK